MAKVSYDNRAITVDGKRTLVLSGAMHYCRSTPGMWPELMKLTKAAGLNTVETYVFWNLHERRRGVYDFSDRLDLRRWCELAAAEGLYVDLRIGPYICAETNFGGLPPWLRDVKGLQTRTWNEPFMREMKQWCRVLTDYVRPLLASNGGPIILVQFENEYGNIAASYGSDGQKYLQWCVEMGQSLKIDVPLIMCMGGVEGAIETINGFYLHEQVADHVRNHPEQPAISTEFYPGWYHTWGFPRYVRDSRNLAYALLRFFAVGGTGMNYYMWHGGTNFDRESMYLQTATYDLDSPLDEYGLPTTKYNHMVRVHRLLTEYADVLLGQDRALPQHVKVLSQAAKRKDEMVLSAVGGGMPGEFVKADATLPRQLAFVYGSGPRRLALLCNDDSSAPASVEFEGKSYELAPQSVVVLGAPGAGGLKVVLDSSRIDPADRIARKMKPIKALSAFESYAEPLPGDWPETLRSPVASKAPVEQLQFTRDQSDYCWYVADVKVSPSLAGKGVLKLHGVADYAYIYIDGKLKASTPTPLVENRNLYPDSDALDKQPVWEPVRKATFEQSFELTLPAGKHQLAVLCCSLGLIKGDWMLGFHNMVNERKGLWAPVTWNGKEIAGWQIQPFLLGEKIGLFGNAGRMLKWSAGGKSGGPRWWRSTFRRPKTDAKLALDLGSMTKGMIYLNGRCLSRYWLLPGNGSDPFSKYRGPIDAVRSDAPLQRYYHVPADWLADENTLVLLEEAGGDVSQVRLMAWQ